MEILTRHERQEAKDTSWFSIWDRSTITSCDVYSKPAGLPSAGDFDHGAVDHEGRDAKAEHREEVSVDCVSHEILASNAWFSIKTTDEAGVPSIRRTVAR